MNNNLELEVQMLKHEIRMMQRNESDRMKEFAQLKALQIGTIAVLMFKMFSL